MKKSKTFVPALIVVLLTAAGCKSNPTKSATALSKADVQALVTGNTLEGEHLHKGFEFAMYVNPDGTLKEKRAHSERSGKWHVDSEGKFCWSYDARNRTWCRWIKKNDDGTYTKYKDSGKEVRRFKVVKGNAL